MQVRWIQSAQRGLGRAVSGRPGAGANPVPTASLPPPAGGTQWSGGSPRRRFADRVQLVRVAKLHAPAAAGSQAGRQRRFGLGQEAAALHRRADLSAVLRSRIESGSSAQLFCRSAERVREVGCRPEISLGLGEERQGCCAPYGGPRAGPGPVAGRAGYAIGQYVGLGEPALPPGRQSKSSSPESASRRTVPGLTPRASAAVFDVSIPQLSAAAQTVPRSATDGAAFPRRARRTIRPDGHFPRSAAAARVVRRSIRHQLRTDARSGRRGRGWGCRSTRVSPRPIARRPEPWHRRSGLVRA